MTGRSGMLMLTNGNAQQHSNGHNDTLKMMMTLDSIHYEIRPSD